MQESDGKPRGMRRKDVREARFFPDENRNEKQIKIEKTPCRNSGRERFETGELLFLAAGAGGELLAHFDLEDTLAHAQVLRGDFQQLVVVDELQTFLQGQGMHGD